MPQLLIRGLAAAVLAIAICPPVLADQATTPPAGVQAILTAMNIEKVGSIAYQDPAGNPIAPEEILKQSATGTSFSVMKKPQKDGVVDVTFRLMSKEAMQAKLRPVGKLKAGARFPEFRFTRIDGTAVDNKALEGRYTLINFYFAQCPPCIREVPDLNALAKSHQDLNVLAVTFDSVEETRRFLTDTGLTWPVIADARKLTVDVGVKGYPSIVLLDPQGKVVATKEGGETSSTGASTLGLWLDRTIAAAK